MKEEMLDFMIYLKKNPTSLHLWRRVRIALRDAAYA